MAERGSNTRYMADINVTPLVDVILVLLIIFMITAPMMVQGINVSLPQTTSKPLPMEKDHLFVTVDGSQQIFINDYKVSLEGLQPKLQKILEGHPQQKVYLRADKRVPYGVVARVISAAKNAGIEKLGMVTEPLEEPQKRR